MEANKPEIDPYLFHRQLEAFKEFVQAQSGVAFVSFASNPYIEKQEGYKYVIHRAARDALAFQAWKDSEIGSGEIVEAVTAAIEIPGNGWGQVLQYDNLRGMRFAWHAPCALNSLEPCII